MESYKQINSELVKQLQEMKIINALQAKEINALRLQSMDDHRTIVILKKDLTTMIANNCYILLSKIHPDLDVFELLCREIKNEKEIFSQTSSIHLRRRSSSILKDLQNSNSILGLRRSISTMSPSRQSATFSSANDSKKTRIVNKNKLNLTESLSANKITKDVATDKSGDETYALEREEEEQEDYVVDAVIKLKELNNESIENSEQTLASPQLDHISEDLNEEDLSSNQQLTNELEASNMSKNIPNSNENTSPFSLRNITNLCRETMVVSPTFNSPKITLRRGKIRSLRKSIEIPRIEVENDQVLTQLPDIGFQNENSSVSCLAMPSLRLKNFEEQLCSTPRTSFLGTDLTNPVQSPVLTETPDRKEIINASLSQGRPRRTCTPQNLTERPLNVKLRNGAAKVKKSKKKN